MLLSEKLKKLNTLKFSFAKSNEHANAFAKECKALSMYDVGFGLGIPATLSNENQLRGVFKQVAVLKGVFLFNISGVNLKKSMKGFASYQEAEDNDQITEWELYMILSNRDYLKNCIFHNGKIQFKKTMLWKSIQ